MQEARTSPAVLAGVAGGIVLAPYATLTLPFRQALYVQAGLILALVLFLGLFGLRRRDRAARPPRSSPAMIVAALLYAAAAGLGALTAVLRGNDLALVLGQSVALGLLPLAWLCSTLARVSRPLASSALGIGGATAVASVFHLVQWLEGASVGAWVRRFFLANATSASPVAIMAALLILPIQRAADRRLRWTPAAGFWLVVTLIVGSGVRGLWVAFGLAVAIAALLDRRLARLIAVRVVLPGAALFVLGTGTGAALESYAVRQCPNLLDPPRLRELLTPGASGFQVEADGQGEAPRLSIRTSPERRWWVLTSPFPIAKRSGILLRVRMRGTAGSETGALGLQWLDASGMPLSTAWTDEAAPGDWRELEAIGTAPAAALTCRLIARLPTTTPGLWRLSGIAVHRLRPSLLAPILKQFHYSRERLASTIAPDLAGDPSLIFRIEESTYLMRAFARAPAAVKIFGHGLGAKFSLPPPPAGTPAWLQSTQNLNYIHNFYVFLFYKLGVAGATLVLGAFAVWTWHLVATARRLPPGEMRYFTVAVAAAWIAYCVWSLASPEVLDFRVAPLWGLLFGCLPCLGSGRKGGVTEEAGEPAGGPRARSC